MAILNYQCNNDHIFESEYTEDTKLCPQCNSISDIIWMTNNSPHRQLQTPIVMFEYSDGTLGVAGGHDSKTPSSAERIEIRSIGDYRKYSKRLNSQLLSKERQRDEKFMEAREIMESRSRANLHYLLSQESDPIARDIYKEALSKSSSKSKGDFREFFSIAMEMDRGNYERD